MRSAIVAALCSLAMGCASVRPLQYAPEDCRELSGEARTLEAWQIGSAYAAAGLGAGTALAEAAKDSKPLTISFAIAAVLAGAVGIGTGSAATDASAELARECLPVAPIVWAGE